MQNLTFGIEIETISQTREAVAQAIQSVVGGSIRYTGGTYDAWTVTDRKGREWKAVTDASLSAPRSHQAEVVSPILKAEDIAELQEVVRALRRAGAKVDRSCGIHLHLGARSFSPQAIGNLAKIVNKQEDLIFAALKVSRARKARWAKPVNTDFLRKIETRRPGNLDDINRAWYGQLNRNPQHYDSSRYHGLNLHNIFYRKTVEFRYFNGTLHAGRIKAYVQFCLALGSKAIESRSAQSKKRDYNPATAKYDFRVFLLGLGMIGDEYKTARHHLLANFEGQSAWRRAA